MGSSPSKPTSTTNLKTHPFAYQTSYGGRRVQIRQPTQKESKKGKEKQKQKQEKKQIQLTRTAPSERYETEEMTRRRLDWNERALNAHRVMGSGHKF